MSPFFKSAHDDLIDSFIDIPIAATNHIIIGDSCKSSDSVSTSTETTLTRTETGPKVSSHPSVSSSSFFNRLLTAVANFNLRYSNNNEFVIPKIPNSASAFSKVWTCFECGSDCTKMEGYVKELLISHPIDTADGSVFLTKENQGEEDEGEEGEGEEVDIDDYLEKSKKIYYHNWCVQRKLWRGEHAKYFQTVLHDLLWHFRALEEKAAALEIAEQEALERRQMAEEESKRLDALILATAKATRHKAKRKRILDLSGATALKGKLNEVFLSFQHTQISKGSQVKTKTKMNYFSSIRYKLRGARREKRDACTHTTTTTKSSASIIKREEEIVPRRNRYSTSVKVRTVAVVW